MAYAKKIILALLCITLIGGLLAVSFFATPAPTSEEPRQVTSKSLSTPDKKVTATTKPKAEEKTAKEKDREETPSPKEDSKEEPLPSETISTEETKESLVLSETASDKKESPTVKEELPEVKEEAPKETVSDTSDKLTCNLSVRCDTILSNMDKLKEEKKSIIPSNGVIYPKKEVVFYEGETAFNVVLREMKQNNIHFEFEYTPVYDSMYVEGIGNIYEFDAGDLSGWLYKVNGKFLNSSLSKYTLKKGDVIEIVYTCSLGKDVK